MAIDYRESMKSQDVPKMSKYVSLIEQLSTKECYWLLGYLQAKVERAVERVSGSTNV